MRVLILIAQLPSEDQGIDQFLAVRQPSRLRYPADDAEAQLLPNADRGRVVGEDQVEDRVLVSL